MELNTIQVKVIKKDGRIEEFNSEKILSAVKKAYARVKGREFLATDIANQVIFKVVDELGDTPSQDISVNRIHILVENALMDLGEYDAAREYISYRATHAKPDIFRKRQNIKPYEYPHLLEYMDAIRHSYWLHTEYNFTADMQDLHSNLSEDDVQVVTRAMLAIAQIENSVKTFWAKVGDMLPKPEIAKVGATFAESEVRHEDAYSHLIEIMGLNSEFKDLMDIPVIKSRHDYLSQINSSSSSPKEYLKHLILFSAIIENISLFSQFLILMSYNKNHNCLKGISNAIEATSKEENIHALFGAELVRIILDENPDWNTPELWEDIQNQISKAISVEMDMIDWILETKTYEEKEPYQEYLYYRANKSLNMLGISDLYLIEDDKIKSVMWFEDEILLGKSTDFFNKRSVDYTKMTQSITAEDLF